MSARRGRHHFARDVGADAGNSWPADRTREQARRLRHHRQHHSQGGQVDLFAAAQGPDYVPSLQLVGNVAFAPASQIADRLKLVTTSDKVELSLPYLLYVLQSFARTDPAIDLARILTPQAIAHLPDLMQGCMTHALTTGYWSKAIAKEQFVASPDFAAFLKFAAKNEPGALKIAAPTMVVQGSADVTVFPAATDGLVRQLCANGNVVDYRVFADADHNGSMTHGAKAAQAWIAARFRGDAAKSACGNLPKAARN
jgi:pimeloyl-ACP methyl ester carboxylesterase